MQEYFVFTSFFFTGVKALCKYYNINLLILLEHFVNWVIIPGSVSYFKI